MIFCLQRGQFISLSVGRSVCLWVCLPLILQFSKWEVSRVIYMTRPILLDSQGICWQPYEVEWTEVQRHDLFKEFHIIYYKTACHWSLIRESFIIQIVGSSDQWRSFLGQKLSRNLPKGLFKNKSSYKTEICWR